MWVKLAGIVLTISLLFTSFNVVAAESSRNIGDVMVTNIICNEPSIKYIIEATTEGNAEAEIMLNWVVSQGGCIAGSHLVRIIARAYTWEDWEGDIFQVWEIQPANSPPPSFRTFTWEHIGGPTYPSTPMRNPTFFRFGQSRTQSI
jgi:hypothetical protein